MVLTNSQIGRAGKICGIGLLALALRLIYVEQQSQSPLFAAPVAGAKTYVDQALQLATGLGDAQSLWPPSSYPYFLAGIFRLGGEGYALPRIVQAFLGAVNCVLLWRLGARVFSPPVALGAGLAAVLYGPLIYFDGALLPPVLAVFFSLLALHALLWAAAGESTKRFGGAGLLLGLAALAGSHVWLFAVVVSIWLLRQQRSWAAGGFCLGFAAMIVPMFFSQTLSLEGLDTHFGLSGRNLYLIWHGNESLAELDPYYARNHSALLAALMWQRGVAFPFGIVAPLALVGLAFRLGSRARERAENLVLLFVAAYVGEALLGSVTAGSRMPLVCVLLLFAAAAVEELCTRSWPQRGPGLGALVALGVGLNMGAGQMNKAAEAVQHHWLGQAYGKFGMKANAIREYQEAISADVDRADSYFALASLYSEAGEYERAIGVYRNLLRRWPEQRRARLALGDHYMMAQRVAEAAAVYQELFAEGEDPAVALGRLGEARQWSGDARGAIQAYRELLEIRPDSGRVRFQLARLYAEQGQTGEAMTGYRRLLDDPAWSVEAGWRLAELMIGIQDTTAAELLLEKTLRLAPDRPPALWMLGEILLQQGRYREALPYFERLRDLDLEDYRIYFSLTRLYARLGREAEAEDAFGLYQQYSEKERRAEIEQRVKAERDILLRDILGAKE